MQTRINATRIIFVCKENKNNDLCYSREWRQTDPEEMKSLNKVIIFVSILVAS